MQRDPHGFKLSSRHHPIGLTLRGAIRVAPQHLTERFGAPSGATADNKVSGADVFEDDLGGRERAVGLIVSIPIGVRQRGARSATAGADARAA